MLKVEDVRDKSAWNTWLLTQQPNTFLQSWEWGQVQGRESETVRYLAVKDGTEQVAAALTITVHARRGPFLFCPHGPIIRSNANKKEVLDILMSAWKQYATEDGAVAIRVAPLLETTPEHTELFSGLLFRPSPIHVHAELTWVLDISPTEDVLLQNMRKTTRHAIKKAANEGVRVEISSDTSAVERFLPLYESTKTRHQFVPFSETFLQHQVETFGESNNMYFAFAKYQRQDVAAAIFMRFGNTVFYHHGASTKLPSSIPAAQLLQWESIQYAKQLGATRYNFWGIAPDDKPNHPFAGITVFKKGFGGQAIDYMHAQDLPLSLGYWKLWAVDSFRKIKRGF